MKKNDLISDLISGKHVVELEDGDKYLFLEDRFVNNRFWYDTDAKICKIFEIQEAYSLSDMLVFDKGLDLIWERKPELSDVERVILENVDKEYRYIAREGNNNLYLYSRKPNKFRKAWASNVPTFTAMYQFNHLFKMIKWEDEEPTLISDLLEVNNNEQ